MMSKDEHKDEVQEEEIPETDEAPEEISQQEQQREYFKARYTEITDLPGVGSATAVSLAEAGYRTTPSLATATIRELTEKGIGEDTAKKVIAEARKAISLGFISAQDLIKIRSNRKLLTTGCANFDQLLNGGLETESITEFYGENGSGKTQICHQLCVTVQLPEEKGGLNGNALYLDTEGTFHPERILQMAETFGLEPGPTLENIVYAEAFTSEHQIALLEAADDMIQEHKIRLIIVDSAIAQFRSEYSGREFLATRQQKLNAHLNKLLRLCRAFNAAGVITNQVVDRPDSYGQNFPSPTGGHIVGHTVHTRVFIRKGRANLRIAKLTKSPSLPEGETPFRITETGILHEENL